MKELTIEQKAKAYDKAFRIAQELYNDPNSSNVGKGYVCTVFPELKENEDDIRKEIIDFATKANNGVTSILANNYDFNSWLAWLEKQDKTTDVEPVFSYKNLVTKKQNAKKPTDKVEPKFKVGDWVVFKNKHQSIYQVEKIEDGYYILRHTHGGTLRVCELHDESLRLWTIQQDAKNGDVVVDKSDGTIGIFKSIGHHPDGGSFNDPSYCFLHCRYDDGYFFADFEDGNMMTSDDVIPATKEQRNTLMKAMADAGYTFDFEKKELKKIEQNNTEEYIETKGLSELEAEAEELTKEISDEIEADKVVIKQGEHNSAWSEEDTETLNGIVNYLFTSTDVSSIEGSDKWYDWLKSLKNRVIPKQEWSEEDEEMLVSIISDFAAAHKSSIGQDKWLKSLKERTKGE